MVALAGTLILVAGCGDDDDGSVPQPPIPEVRAEASSSAAPNSDTAKATSAAPVDAVEGQTIEIDLVGGKPTEKIGNVTVAEGDTITLVVTSDKAYEVHVHGLDVSMAVAAGETATKTFAVDLAPGSYEVEVEDTGFLLFNLKVE